MNRRKQAVLLPLALAAVCLMAADVLAADGHEEYRWGDFAWRILNFIIFFGILWHFTGRLIKKFFRERREGIKNTLDGLEERRKAAKARLADVEKHIANLDAERKAILDESRVQAEALRQAIVEDARRQAAQIVEQAKSAAEREGRSILAQVRATLADELVDATEKMLTEKLGPAEHDRLITNSLNKVVLH